VKIVSQVLFGEDFEILEKTKQWSRIKMHFDMMKLDRFKNIKLYPNQISIGFLTNQYFKF
jgi:hypothetical protein